MSNIILTAHTILLSFLSGGSYYFIVIYTINHFSKENVLKGFFLIILLKFIVYTIQAIHIAELSKKLNNFARKFASCVFVEHQISECLSSDFIHFLRNGYRNNIVFRLIIKNKIVRIFSIEKRDNPILNHLCIQGASFPSHIFLRDFNERMDVKTSFCINHEVAHASIDGTLAERMKINMGSELSILYILFCAVHPYFLFFAAIGNIFRNVYIHMDEKDNHTTSKKNIFLILFIIFNILYMLFLYRHENVELVTAWIAHTVIFFYFYQKLESYHYLDNEILADKIAVNFLPKEKLDSFLKYINACLKFLSKNGELPNYDNNLSKEDNIYRFNKIKKIVEDCKNEKLNIEEDFTHASRFYHDPELQTLFTCAIISKIFLASRIHLLPEISWNSIWILFSLVAIYHLLILSSISINILCFNYRITSKNKV